FYDALGSALFEAICQLPEYYLTRAEDEILSRHAEEIALSAACGENVTLVEFGSGSSTKTRRVIEALLRRQNDLLYVPIDISRAALESAARALLDSFPRLRVEGYAADYDTALARLNDEAASRGRTLALFLGSNVGNFDADEAEAFLRRVRAALRAGDALLVGADLKKDAKVLEDAYDDPLGVTAAFNLNLLARINRGLGADFDPRAFRHVARYDERAGRVEMHIESLRAQTVRVASLPLEIKFDAGERVHTENSYKYDPPALDALAARSGFRRAKTWLDEGARFSSNLFTALSETEPRHEIPDGARRVRQGRSGRRRRRGGRLGRRRLDRAGTARVVPASHRSGLRRRRAALRREPAPRREGARGLDVRRRVRAVRLRRAPLVRPPRSAASPTRARGLRALVERSRLRGRHAHRSQRRADEPPDGRARRPDRVFGRAAAQARRR
ncbi:MAG: L-histidine N(alpha)-methyltransferase, partial [Acidobacteriota bacterium]|nr:L-histidine N(alpha)-methyltransferase [Acidobacteriota bacterium]